MEKIIELTRKPEKGFGFSVIGGADTHLPPMVCALVKDSPAFNSGEIHVGDVLVKVNGAFVADLSIKEIVSLIRNSPDQIVISVKDDSDAKMKARPFLADKVRHVPPTQEHDRQARHPNCYHDALSGGGKEVSRSNSSPKASNGRPELYGAPFYTPTGSQQAHNEFIPSYEDATRHSVMRETASKSSTYPHRNTHTRRSYNNMSKSPLVGSSMRNEPHIDSFYDSQYKSHQMRNYEANDLLDQISGTGRAPQHKIGLLSPMQSQPSNGSSVSQNSAVVTLHSNGQVNGNGYANRKYLTQSQSDSTIANSAYPHSTLRQRQENGYGNGSLSRNTSSCDAMDGRSSSKLSVASSIPPSPSSASSTGSFLSNRLPFATRTTYDYGHADRFYPATMQVTGNTVSYETSPAATVQERYYNGSAPATPEANSFDRRGVHRRPIHASAHPDTSPTSPTSRTFQHGVSPMLSNTDGPSPNFLQVHKDSDASESSSFPGTGSSSFDTTESSSSDANTLKPGQAFSLQEGPGDVAAKLFTLNGYKDSEVAPLLGKNNDYSQSICKEYLKFFDFRGLSLDEALRLFLKKFPLTGETQERERILVHFSKRYYNCNDPPYGSEDAMHTLTCSLMLLNSDLHGQNIGNKMTLPEFINNLSGLCDGKDFPKDLLKALYSSIKTRQMEWLTPREAKDYVKGSPRMRRKNSSPGNPFVELKVDDNAVVMKEGLMYRKSVMDADGKRTPAIRRGWKLFYGILRGLVLFLYKADQVSCEYPLTIGIHHALAGYANDYKKRPFVFKLITADWRVYLFQSKSKADVQEWIDSVNMSAAVLSAPPLPAPCSSNRHFQRPVMPVSTTRLAIGEQLQKHEDQRKEAESEVVIHRDLQPKPSAKEYKDWESKMDYLEFALKRFSSYVHVLTTVRLKPGIDVLVASRTRGGAVIQEPKTAPGFDNSRRSNSVGDFSTMRTSPTTQRKNSKQRQSYLMAVYP